MDILNWAKLLGIYTMERGVGTGSFFIYHHFPATENLVAASYMLIENTAICSVKV